MKPEIDRSPERGAASEVCAATANYIAADLQPLIVPIASLTPAPDNARKHGAADLDALTDSFLNFGQVRPFLGKRTYRGLRDVILCGNGGLAAALRLGWRFVAVAWLPETTTDDGARRLAVLDNRLAELSAWDSTALAALQADGLDLLDVWHDDAALADLLGENTPTPTFAPVDVQHRLDELQPHCKTCTCRQGARS
jgi:ParB-like chromosome segregation protein Spo0J